MLLKLQGVQGSPLMLTIKGRFIFCKLPKICCNCCLFKSWTIAYSHLITASLLLAKLQRVELPSLLVGWKTNAKFLSPSLEAGHPVRYSYPLLPLLTLIPLPLIQSVTCQKKGKQYLSMSPIYDRHWQLVLIGFSLTQLTSLSNKIK